MASKGNKPHKSRCEQYRKDNRRLKNKKVKLQRHLKKQPNDKQAKAALGEL